VDVDAASERGIAVANVPTSLSGGADSVAEWCVMGALVLSRRATELTALIRWGHAWGSPMGRAMHGRSACIIGLGDIGKALAARLATFGMHLIAVSRTPDEAAAKLVGCDAAIGLDNLEHALAVSDYVFLCLPHTPATHHLINAAMLAIMRPGATLINPGRGGLVDQEALLAAINSGHLGGCALDVFTPEPLPKDSPLLQRANILATPHIAGITDGTYGQIANFIVTAHAAVSAGRLPANCVNESRIARYFQP
jgi:phosphoglycerate dehydrogenase-like enzyme